MKRVVTWETMRTAKATRDIEKRDTSRQPEHVIRGVGVERFVGGIALWCL